MPNSKKNFPLLNVIVAIIGNLFFLSSCVTVGPNYKKPVVAHQATWAADAQPQSPPSKTSGQTTTEIWWNQFTDRPMDQLITRVQAANPRINRAKARIDEAHAQSDVIRAGKYPHADFNGEFSTGIGSFDQPGLRFNPGQPVFNLAQVDSGWTIDIFGERRRMIEATERNLEAQVEGWRNSYLFFTGDVALHYIDVRVAEARHQLAGDKVKVYKNIEHLTRQLEQSGYASKVTVTEAYSRTKSEQAKLPRFEREAAVARLTLGRIAALSPDAVKKILDCGSGIPNPPSSISTPFPAEVLRNRPDIRIAERMIAVQVSNVGVATANFYPRLSLNGAITYESLFRNGVEELLEHTIGSGSRLRHRIYHGGADQARLKEQEAILESRVRDYEEVVLQALMEVEAALVSIHYARKEIKELEQAVDAKNQAADAMVKGFEEGLVENADLLRVQEERFETQEELIFAKNLLARSAVSLYLATGGGKTPIPPKESAPMPEVTEVEGNRVLSTIFSTGKDRKKTLHISSKKKRGRN